jgi:hypothetical protein
MVRLPVVPSDRLAVDEAIDHLGCCHLVLADDGIALSGYMAML